MFENEVVLYQFTLEAALRVAEDIPEEEMLTAPFPGANPPVWILGHLAICTDSAARLLGLQRECPREWHVRFGPGSKPAELAAPLPTKGELLEALKKGHERVAAAAPTADPQAMGQPQEFPILQGRPLKTIGHVVAHLMSTHEAFHVAQLSACRRKLGKPALF